MKFLSMLALLSTTAFAAEPINLLCVTEIPTTSFVAETKGDVLTIRLIHHNGVKFMPIHNGLITPYDLGTLSDRADVIADLGEDLNFEIPLDKCEAQDNYLFNCFKSMPSKKINGHDVSIWSVYTSRTVDQSFAGEFKYIQTSIAIDVDGKSYHLPMKYGENECYPNFEKSKLLKLK